MTSSEAPSTALTGAAAAEDMIAAFTVHDVRFPTSRQRDGSDAMNPYPDYSAAYLEVRTTRGDEGYALVFTPGRGNDLQAAAIRTLEPFVRDVPVDLALADLRSFSRRLTTDGQLRWLGPEKGPIHMAAGAIVNAMWDLAARRADLPLWRLLADLRPDQLVDLIDFTYLRDAMTEDEALQILRRAEPGRDQRIAHLMSAGHPAYTTTPGWLGYTDERLVALSQEAVADGFRMIKLKVGGDLADDRRRLGLVRQAVGPDIHIAIDANQIWGVPDAIAWVNALRPFDPYWIEEPTFPDDVLGHAAIRRSVAPVRVATGEHTANAVMFKQLLQAGAIDVVQIDACRVAGVNENIAIMLLAAKFGVPICPHAGGVGLCEMVQHLAMFDYVAVSGSHEGRYVEYVDHLHEHFTNPVQVSAGAYAAPTAPGSGARMKPASVARYTYPDGAAWVDGG